MALVGSHYMVYGVIHIWAIIVKLYSFIRLASAVFFSQSILGGGRSMKGDMDSEQNRGWGVWRLSDVRCTLQSFQILFLAGNNKGAIIRSNWAGNNWFLASIFFFFQKTRPKNACFASLSPLIPKVSSACSCVPSGPFSIADLYVLGCLGCRLLARPGLFFSLNKLGRFFVYFFPSRTIRYNCHTILRWGFDHHTDRNKGIEGKGKGRN